MATNEDGRLGDDMNRLLWRALACEWLERRAPTAAALAAGEVEAAGTSGGFG